VSPPVESLVSRLHAKRSGKGWLAKCPAHDDRKPSLSIDEGSDGRALLKCHAGCSMDDVIGALGLTGRDLFPVTLQRQSGNGVTSKPTFDWQKCVDAFTAKHLERLSDWRGYTGEFCSWLHKAGLIGLFNDCIAFPVPDRAGKVVAAHYRQKDGSWRYYPQGAKVRPLVIGDLLPGDPVHVFESQFDTFSFADLSGERSGMICTRGATNGALAADVIPQGATVYLWPQNDAPGEKWAKDVAANTKATVKCARIHVRHKDLSDWTHEGATADDLLAAMLSAEIVREVERSWTDALNAAVVTSSELHDLKLKPRKKLLGD